MKTLVAAMLAGEALAGGCAMAGDERPEDPWVLVNFRSGEQVGAYRRVTGPFGDGEAGSGSVRLLRRKAQAECAKHGRRAGAPSRGEVWPGANPWPPGSPWLWVETRFVPLPGGAGRRERGGCASCLPVRHMLDRRPR